VRGAKHELVRPLVVEIDKARVCLQRLGNLAGDEPEHLLEIECRVDRLDGLGQEPEMALADVHASDCRSR
jgi:hypothetical protein